MDDPNFLRNWKFPEGLECASAFLTTEALLEEYMLYEQLSTLSNRASHATRGYVPSGNVPVPTPELLEACERAIRKEEERDNVGEAESVSTEDKRNGEILTLKNNPRFSMNRIRRYIIALFALDSKHSDDAFQQLTLLERKILRTLLNTLHASFT